MSNTVIRVENLSKEYRLGDIGHGSLHRDMQSWWARIRGKDDPNSRIDTSGSAKKNKNESFWALKDVSFDVEQGEVLGIIGRNGAGKSTLLKILSRVTAPTSGTIKIKGRIASLLEVGTGFHPELSGRDNIYLNGTILGMKKREIDAKFDEIVKFAEVEKFIDTPVKRYSSGMYVRLAFAVAAHLEPEILIIDEVLAVGDAAFQKKCLGKMGDVAKGGRTVLFVSHNMDAVLNLCKKAILLEGGKMILYADTKKIVDLYIGANEGISGEKVWNDISNAPGDDIVRLHAVRIRNDTGIITTNLDIQKPLYIEMEFWNFKPNARLVPNIHFYNNTGIHLFASATNHDNNSHPLPIGLIRAICKIPGNLFADGRIKITTNISTHGFDNIIHLSVSDVLSFNVEETYGVRGKYIYGWPGVLRPSLEWTLDKYDNI
ncbi:MAG: ABC transporter ATP-binding protein [Candidatus Methanoperedenaceae archaeon]|nr:ABC transporter ATP-binding protein [Candidatus Methanoperedenaceae archaeon]